MKTLSDIKLLHGDCLELIKDIPEKSIDMILCDLPYGQTARNKWDVVIPMEDYIIKMGETKTYNLSDWLLRAYYEGVDYQEAIEFFDRYKNNGLWTEYNRVIKDNGAIVLFANGMFTADLIHSNRKMWRYNLVWQKTTPTGFLNANRMPLRCHEDICVFYKKPPQYNPQKTFGHKRKVSTAEHKRNSAVTTDYGKHNLKTYDSTERYPTSVLTFPTDKQKCALHPTQKPVALCECIIKTYTNEGDTVLDNTMGSGTSGVACINTNRNFIGIENDDKIFEISKQRIAKSQ